MKQSILKQSILDSIMVGGAYMGAVRGPYDYSNLGRLEAVAKEWPPLAEAVRQVLDTARADDYMAGDAWEMARAVAGYIKVPPAVVPCKSRDERLLAARWVAGELELGFALGNPVAQVTIATNRASRPLSFLWAHPHLNRFLPHSFPLPALFVWSYTDRTGWAFHTSPAEIVHWSYLEEKMYIRDRELAELITVVCRLLGGADLGNVRAMQYNFRPRDAIVIDPEE